MWRRLRRKMLTPSRPAVHPDQAGLVLFTVLAIGGGIYMVLRVLAG